MNTTYPSDLSDTEWECLQQYLRASQSNCRSRRDSFRSILNALSHPGKPCSLIFAADLLRGRWTLLFKGLYNAERQRLGRNPHASAAIMDAQSVKTVEESAHISGFDAHKRVKGREALI
jgi:putative transposase